MGPWRQEVEGGGLGEEEEEGGMKGSGLLDAGWVDVGMADGILVAGRGGSDLGLPAVGVGRGIPK